MEGQMGWGLSMSHDEEPKQAAVAAQPRGLDALVTTPRHSLRSEPQPMRSPGIGLGRPTNIIRRVEIDDASRKLTIHELDVRRLADAIGVRVARAIDDIVTSGSPKTLSGLVERLQAMGVTLIPRFKPDATEPFGLILVTDAGALHASKISTQAKWGTLKAAGWTVGDVTAMKAVDAASTWVGAKVIPGKPGDGGDRNWHWSPKDADLASSDKAIELALKGEFLAQHRPQVRGDLGSGRHYEVTLLQGIVPRAETDIDPARRHEYAEVDGSHYPLKVQSKGYTDRGDGTFARRDYDEAAIVAVTRLDWHGDLTDLRRQYPQHQLINGDVADPRLQITNRGYQFSTSPLKGEALDGYRARQANRVLDWDQQQKLKGGYTLEVTKAKIPDIVPVARNWAAADVDHVALPDGLDPLKDPEAACRWYVRAALPEQFHDAAFSFELSSSAGMTKIDKGIYRVESDGTLSAHIYFDVAAENGGRVLPKDAGIWMEAAAKRNGVPADLAIMKSPNQLCYPAPAFSGGDGSPMADPIENRFGRSDGNPTVVMPSAALEKVEAAKARTASGASAFRLPGGDM
jgi:hypothetical protein